MVTLILKTRSGSSTWLRSRPWIPLIRIAPRTIQNHKMGTQKRSWRYLDKFNEHGKNTRQQKQFSGVGLPGGQIIPTSCKSMLHATKLSQLPCNEQSICHANIYIYSYTSIWLCLFCFSWKCFRKKATTERFHKYRLDQSICIWTDPSAIWTDPWAIWTVPCAIWTDPCAIWTDPCPIWTDPCAILTDPCAIWTDAFAI
jgi:hypothetical protein